MLYIENERHTAKHFIDKFYSTLINEEGQTQVNTYINTHKTHSVSRDSENSYQVIKMLMNQH